MNDSKDRGYRHNFKIANQIRVDINSQVYKFQHVGIKKRNFLKNSNVVVS